MEARQSDKKQKRAASEIWPSAVDIALPDELWVHIFKFLTLGERGKIARVCSHFYNITRDVSFWAHTTVDARTKFAFAI